MTTLAEVRLWGSRIGAVSLEDDQAFATFEYEPDFARSGIEVSPISMPLAEGRAYRFPGLAPQSFKGLPGLLADSLPDRYGNTLIDTWLASRGRAAESAGAVERLCIVGNRGMGALELRPEKGPAPAKSHAIDVEALTELAAEILAQRADLIASLRESSRTEALKEILRVGTSAGGARAKALIALHPETNEVRSGQLDVDPGFEHWILKFDGVDERSRELGGSLGYGAVEWVYSQLAARAGIEMSECRLLEDSGRRHFMTRRFDRLPDGGKLHMQSLGALAHLDYNQPRSHSYEEAFLAMRQLGLPMSQVEEQFRRMAFNVVARNQDDHVKNIAYLMDRGGEWRLSPAFDIVYAYSSRGGVTAQHQMSANGKRDGFTIEDFREVGRTASMKRGRAEAILGEVVEAVRAWPELAAGAGVEEQRIARIGAAHRLAFPDR
ncbi:MAG: type II toxin-antitoxin system HipA family toxin [Chloroflexota bacterium]